MFLYFWTDSFGDKPWFSFASSELIILNTVAGLNFGGFSASIRKSLMCLRFSFAAVAAMPSSVTAFFALSLRFGAAFMAFTFGFGFGFGFAFAFGFEADLTLLFALITMGGLVSTSAVAAAFGFLALGEVVVRPVCAFGLDAGRVAYLRWSFEGVTG